MVRLNVIDDDIDACRVGADTGSRRNANSDARDAT
jgi:hypothetical protein